MRRLFQYRLRNSDLTKAAIRDQAFEWGRRLLDHLRYSLSYLLKLVTLRRSMGEVLI